MNGYQLRAAEQHDQEIIRRLINQARINPMGLDWERFVVAEADNIVIGCCQVKPHKDGSHELASLVVRPEWRGKGIARALIEHFQAQHPGQLYLTCRTDLGDFYKKFGFREVPIGEMPRYFRAVFLFINAGKLIGREGLRILVMASGDNN